MSASTKHKDEFDDPGVSTQPYSPVKEKKSSSKKRKHDQTTVCPQEASSETKRAKSHERAAKLSENSATGISVGPVPPYCFRCTLCDVYFSERAECMAHLDEDHHLVRATNYKKQSVTFELCFYAKPINAEPFLYYEDRVPKQTSSRPLYWSSGSSSLVDHTHMEMDHAPMVKMDHTQPDGESSKGSGTVTDSPGPRTRSAVVGSLLDTAKDSEYRQLVYSDIVTNHKFDFEMRCNICRYTNAKLPDFCNHLQLPSHMRALSSIKAVDDVAYEHVTLTVKRWTKQAVRSANILIKKRKREITRAVQCSLCGASILPHRKQIVKHTKTDRTHLEAVTAKQNPYTTFVFERKIKL